MKGKSEHSRRISAKSDSQSAEALAAEVFGALAADPERLGRFLAATGLDPRGIRAAASELGFLPAVLDHVLGDEDLLLAVAGEIGAPPDRIAAAQARLAPAPDWDA